MVYIRRVLAILPPGLCAFLTFSTHSSSISGTMPSSSPHTDCIGLKCSFKSLIIHSHPLARVRITPLSVPQVTNNLMISGRCTVNELGCQISNRISNTGAPATNVAAQKPVSNPALVSLTCIDVHG